MSAGLDVEAVLAEHESYDYGGPGVIECACSWKSERLGPQWNGRRHERHRAHVAAKVREAVAEWIESEAVVRPAAEAMEDAAFKYLGRDLGTIHRDDIAAAALSALAEAVRYA